MTSSAAMTDSVERLRSALGTVTAEEAEAFKAEEEAANAEERLRASGIPAEFAGAEISACPEAVKAYAREVYRGGIGDLLLSGQVGRGKTHAACAILRAVAPKRRVKFVSAQEIAEAANDWSRSEWLACARGVEVLVIDDLGNETPSPKSIAAIKAILDKRRNHRPTIVTTQLPRDRRGTLLGERYGTEAAKAMASRLSLPREVTITGEDRRRHAR